ncbi:MFS transporter [Enterobacter asburiae]|nr:MFS transporter [Enterobacter asburiae]EKX8899226.1 MFS transporter [Enterobacter asburiae]
MATTMKIPSRELWSYFGYGLGQCFSFGLVGSFINYFYTDVLGISALAASTIFLIARAWDAVHDPLFASIMDTINSRFGKFRHFLLIAPLLITGVTLLSFYKIEADMTTKILYAGVTYILWGTLYAISDIPFWSMSSVMTNDSAQRTRAVTAAMLGVNAGIACANIFFPKLAAFFAQYSNDKGYFMAALVMMLVGLPLMLNGFMQIKERVPPSPEKVTIRDTFHNLRQNKPLFIVLLSFFFCVFHNVAGGLYIYFFINNLGDGSLQMAIGVMGIVAAVLCLVAPMLTRRMQKRKLFMVLCGLDVAVRVVMWFVGYQQVTMLFILLGLSTLFVMMTNILTSSMIADTIEYAEYHTHKRCAAITFSGQTFTGKMSVAVGGGLIGVFLTMIGYVPQAQIQSEGVLSGLFFGICLLPAIGSLIRIVFMSRFTFTEEKHAEICRLLAERNASAKAPGGGCALPGLQNPVRQ